MKLLCLTLTFFTLSSFAEYKDIFEAAKANDFKAVKEFIESGADVNVVNEDGDTPIRMTTDENIKNYLIDNGFIPRGCFETAIQIIEKAEKLSADVMAIHEKVYGYDETIKRRAEIFEASYTYQFKSSCPELEEFEIEHFPNGYSNDN